ncbi:MAG: sigma factor-like helix-turn-helix DNA-binding protein [Oscillospiraceae bacterium]
MELDVQGQNLLSLRYSGKLTMEEIGQIYGISRMAVSKRLKKLHESWEALSHDRASQLQSVEKVRLELGFSDRYGRMDKGDEKMLERGKMDRDLVVLRPSCFVQK